MRFIVDNKLYDTDKATLIYSEYKIRNRRDYYKTHKGTYFVHYVSKGEIAIVSEEDIRDLLAIKDVDKYIELFGIVDEG